MSNYFSEKYIVLWDTSFYQFVLNALAFENAAEAAATNYDERDIC